MNGHEEEIKLIGSRISIIDRETGEELASFDSVPAAIETIEFEELETTAPRDVDVKVDMIIGHYASADYVNASVDWGGILQPGSRIDIEGTGVPLRPGQKIPKRKRQRKKWFKRHAKEFHMKNVLVGVEGK